MTQIKKTDEETAAEFFKLEEETPIKRGRKKETAEQKEARKQKKLNDILTDENLVINQLKNVKAGIKQTITKLSAKDIEKIKNSLSDMLNSIDVTLKESQEKEEEERKRNLFKEIDQLEKRALELRSQL
jgi:type II secretory pathway component PulF